MSTSTYIHVHFVFGYAACQNIKISQKFFEMSLAYWRSFNEEYVPIRNCLLLGMISFQSCLSHDSMRSLALFYCAPEESHVNSQSDRVVRPVFVIFYQFCKVSLTLLFFILSSTVWKTSLIFCSYLKSPWDDSHDLIRIQDIYLVVFISYL